MPLLSRPRLSDECVRARARTARAIRRAATFKTSSYTQLLHLTGAVMKVRQFRSSRSAHSVRLTTQRHTCIAHAAFEQGVHHA